MNEAFVEFIRAPSRETYLAVREQILASEAFQPYSTEFEAAGELYAQQKVEEARDVLRQAMGNLLLSPCAHQLLGFLNSKLGDEQAGYFELMIHDKCIEGILATGDGSAASPFVVLRTSDEYDVLKHLGKELKTQSLQRESDKCFDVMDCTDGSQLWFDITDAYGQLSKSLRP